MKNKLKIKIRKKSAIAEKPETVEVAETAVENTMSLKSTVKGWVTELHERQRQETETARKQFDS